MHQRLDRAKRAGVAGLIVTLDWSFSHGRDWGSPFIPERINWEAVRRYAPAVALRPRWLSDWAKPKRLPDLTVPNMGVAGGIRTEERRVWKEWGSTCRSVSA